MPPTTPSNDLTGASAIIDPSVFTFFGFTVHVSTNQRDPWTGELHSVPWIINNGDGTISANLAAWDVLWVGSGGHYNQGAPKYAADGSLTNPAPVGTYDVGTGIYDLTWESLIVDGPFDGGLGYWRLTGHFNSTAPTAPTGDINQDGKVDVGDAMLAERISSGAWVPDATSAYNADVEPYMSGGAADGVVDVRDVLRICRMAGMGI
jgi:hypothetical protein